MPDLERLVEGGGIGAPLHKRSRSGQYAPRGNCPHAASRQTLVNRLIEACIGVACLSLFTGCSGEPHGQVARSHLSVPVETSPDVPRSEVGPAVLSCASAAPPGYEATYGEATTVGELRRFLAQLGPIVTDNISHLYPGASDASPAIRCWARDSGATFVVYSLGPGDQFSQICEVTVTSDDVPPVGQRGPIC